MVIASYLLVKIVDIFFERNVRLHVTIVAVATATARVETGTTVPAVIKCTKKMQIFVNIPLQRRGRHFNQTYLA